MRGVSSLASIAIGVLFLIASFASLSMAASNTPSMYGAGGPHGRCNTAVSYWDASINDCRYIGGAKGYYNTQAVNWYTNNPHAPAYFNPYVKYNTWTANGVTHVYDTPVYRTNYNVGGKQYHNAYAIRSTPYAGGYALPSNAPNMRGFAVADVMQPGIGNTYASDSFNTRVQADTYTYANAFNTYDHSFNTNNYYNGYNGLYAASPYTAYNCGASCFNYNYAYGASGYYNYHAYAPYISSTMPSWYLYYWRG